MEVKPGYKQTEVGVIPKDWEAKTIDSIAFVTSGKRLPLGSSLTEQETPHPYIRVVDMRPGTVSLSDIRFVPVKVFPAIKRYRIFKEDIFISVAGTLGLVGKVPPELNGANLTENADRITNITCSQDYLLHVLMSPLVQNTIDSLQTVGAQPKLALTRIRKFVIPLPPSKAEQDAIAEALSDADAHIDSLEQLIGKKRQLKQGAMQELLTGKRRLPGFVVKTDYKQTEVGLIPEDWEIANLGSLLAGAPSYGINAPAISYDSRHPTYLRITDISEDGRFIDSSKVSVKHPLASAYMLNEGDLVLARTGASVGKSYLYNRHDGELIFAGFLICVRPDTNKLEPTYLKYFVISNSYWNWVRVNSMRSGQPGINGQEYGSLPIPLPPTKTEQEAIAAFLSDMDAEIASLEAKLTKARQIKQGMMQELLTGRIRLL
jgi:type I restriction enzyme S subunit